MSNKEPSPAFIQMLKKLAEQGEVGVTEVRITNEQIAAAGGVGKAVKAAIEKAVKEYSQNKTGETTPGQAQSQSQSQTNQPEPAKTCCGECQQADEEVAKVLDTLEEFLGANGTDLHPALNNLTPTDCLDLLKIHEIGGKMFVEGSTEDTTPESTAVYFISTLLHLLDAFNNRNESAKSEE